MPKRLKEAGISYRKGGGKRYVYGGSIVPGMYQEGGETKKANKTKKDYNKTYKDIYKKEGRVTASYKNQKDLEKNIRKGNKTHNKKFKTVSAVNKAGKQDVSKAKSFNEAFAIARNTGKKNFDFKGKKYNTRYKEETPKQFKKSHQPNTPENRARVKDIQKRKNIGRSVSNPKGGDINYIDPASKWSNKRKKYKYGGHVVPGMYKDGGEKGKGTTQKGSNKNSTTKENTRTSTETPAENKSLWTRAKNMYSNRGWAGHKWFQKKKKKKK